jgi:hypothetical protein
MSKTLKSIISFNQSGRDLITGEKQRENVFNRFNEQNILGGLDYINRWRNR